MSIRIIVDNIESEALDDGENEVEDEEEIRQKVHRIWREKAKKTNL